MIKRMVSQKLTPLDNLDYKLMDWTIKTIDAFFIHNVKPKIGSIVYCNLAIVVEHTGIYVGDGKIVHVNYSATSCRASCIIHYCSTATRRLTAKSYTMSAGVGFGRFPAYRSIFEVTHSLEYASPRF